tara:strand:- start:13654 stop:14487 length:834 start_codon:yes stop_codon:yes gene_type:complete
MTRACHLVFTGFMATTCISLSVSRPALGQQVEINDTQIQYNRGQNVAPIYEGWIQKKDGSIDLWFGYLNRNYEEVLHIPVGENNKIEPGDTNQGQPSVFIPRRRSGGAMSRREGYVFRLTLPPGTDPDIEVTWTVSAYGHTDRAVATLLPVYALEPPADGNKPPTVSIDPNNTQTTTSNGVTLTASVSDDGLPENQQGTIKWEQYHGPGNITFTPTSSPIPVTTETARDVKLTTTAFFDEPGIYKLRAVVNDGATNPAGYPRVPSTTFENVTVTVTQ